MSARKLQTMKPLSYLYKVCSATYALSRCYSSFKCMSSVKKCITLNSKPTNESFESRNPNKFPPIVNTWSRSYSCVVVSDLKPLGGTNQKFDDLGKKGELKEAVALLKQSKIPVVDMDRYLFLMKKCGESHALEQAKEVHDLLKKSVPHLDVNIHNKILEMYLQCGSMEDAYKVFNEMPQRNLTSWDTMITWLAQKGHGEDAIEIFTKFKRVGLKPNNKMFHGVFAACSVVGDMREGLLHFESMGKNYNLVPSIDDYVRVVDMLGSSGYLNEAIELIEDMPMEPSVKIWEIMMNQCRAHGVLELGDRCGEIVNLLDPSCLDEQSKQGLMPKEKEKEKEKRKSSGINLREIEPKRYDFRFNGDTCHPNQQEIYSQLWCLKQPMIEAGYVPQTRSVLHDVDLESKQEYLLSHSERLALSLALLSSPARAQIRIVKNYRFCHDCHNAFKIISKMVGRLIVSSDRKRFHIFQNGVCSCGDYW